MNHESMVWGVTVFLTSAVTCGWPEAHTDMCVLSVTLRHVSYFVQAAACGKFLSVQCDPMCDGF